MCYFFRYHLAGNAKASSSPFQKTRCLAGPNLNASVETNLGNFIFDEIEMLSPQFHKFKYRYGHIDNIEFFIKRIEK